MNSNQRLSHLARIVFCGFIISILFHYSVAHYAPSPLNYYPYDTFLFKSDARFSDFSSIYDASQKLAPYTLTIHPFPSAYFPFVHLLMYPFTKIHGNTVLLLYLIGFSGFLFYFLRRRLLYLVTQNERFYVLTILSFMTYPFLYLMDRSNLEGLIFIFLVLFFERLEKNKDTEASIWLSLAIAIKAYPALFAFLFLAKKKYRAFLLSTLVPIALTLMSSLCLHGGLSETIRGLQFNLTVLGQDMLEKPLGIQHSSSLYGIFRLLLASPYQRLGTPWSTLYAILAGVTLLLSMWIIWAKRPPIWISSTLLIAFAIVVPSVSFDYKLIHLWIPIVLFIAKKETSRLDPLWLGAFGLLLIPKDYYWIVEDVSISSVLNPLLLLLLIVLAWTTAVQTPKFKSR